jgi:hypothetical protein
MKAASTPEVFVEVVNMVHALAMSDVGLTTQAKKTEHMFSRKPKQVG